MNTLKWRLSSGLIGLLWLLAPHPSQAMTVTVDSAAVTVGDSFSINLNVVDAVSLTSWQVDLGYDPSILRADLVSEGPFLSSAGTTLFTAGAIDNTTGLISLVQNSFVDLSPPSGSGVLATIDFTALSPGVSPLILSNVFLNGVDSGFTITNGSVTVSAVPTPENGSLLLMGLSGLALWEMRQRWYGKTRPLR